TRAAPFWARYAWLGGYAATADSAAAADRAIAAAPKFSPMPAFLVRGAVAAMRGEVERLAGHLEEAAPLLEAAAVAGVSATEPLLFVRTRYRLGLLYEAKQDKDRACAAFKAVVDRWGTAKPKSVTADAAREHMKTLECP